MKKTFEYKDARELIGYYKSIFKQIYDGIKFYDACKYNINESINHLSNSLYFNWIIENILKNKFRIIEEDSKFKSFISSIYFYKKSLEFKTTCQSLLDNYKYKIDKLITNLSIGSNPLLYFFTFKSKKIDIEESYKELLNIKRGLLIEEVNKITDNIENIKKVEFPIIYLEYKNHKEEYKNIIKETSSYKSNVNKLAPIFANDYREFIYLSNSLNKYFNLLEPNKNKIKNSLNVLLAEDLMNILKTIPTEELSKDKSGVRVKCLKNANYNTLADIYTSNVIQIASIPGISNQLAYIIKNKCDNYAKKIYHEIKIKISIDNKTCAASNVIRNVYEYIKDEEFIDRINNLNIECGNKLKDIFSLFTKIGNGIEVIFQNEQELEKLRSSYKFEKDIFDSKYKSIINKINEDYSNIKINTEIAWNCFSSNSIIFYNVIEKIYPEVLGNNDGIYCIPEGLAKEIQSQTFFSNGLLCKLRRYQEWGVKFILHQEKVLLGDEMGLGKTIEAIATMVSLKNTGATHFLVVCPASVINNWCREVTKHSNLKITKIYGSGKIAAFESWLRDGDVAITNYESTSYLKFDENFKYSLLVVDEAHYIKNQNTRRSKNTVRLSLSAERLLFMTGTALENNVDEMISLIDILRPSIAASIKKLAFIGSAQIFKEKIAPVYYRRKREDVLTELPRKIEIKEWCSLENEEESLYEKAILNRERTNIIRVSWNVNDLNKSSKAKRLKKIIESAKLENRKVLVFSFYLETLDKIYNFFKGICLTPINGSVNINKRQEIIDEFDKAPEGTVLLAQITTGGTGLNIQSASIVVICEPQFKPSTENQAISRAYRMGQVRDVLIYRLLCENTIDEKIIEILEKKQQIFDTFADKSLAAEQDINIDDKSFEKIIDEEIKRIKSKRGIPSEASLDVKNIPIKPIVPMLHKFQYNPITIKEKGEQYYSKLMKMSYYELVQFLINEYGPAKCDYFSNEYCSSKNKKVVRSSEGLFCHHIDEDKAIKLSSQDYAINNPFEYQKKERLVYCNFLEHLLLHILIYEEFNNFNTTEEKFGIGGALYITSQLNDYYNDYQFKKEYLIIASSLIKDDYNSYIIMLKRLYKDMCKKEKYPPFYNKGMLSSGYYNKFYEKIFNAL